MKIINPSVELLTITELPAQLLEKAGRTCYKSEDKITPDSAAKFVKMICRNKHESVIEHANATFRIICDRGISHEIVRHRLFAYSQESTRYVNYGKSGEISVIKPHGITGDAELAWSMSCESAEWYYNDLLNQGYSPQIARSVLPTCLKTELVMSGNFRSWKHFIAMRTAKTAHPDIRYIADWIQEVLSEKCPEVF